MKRQIGIWALIVLGSFGAVLLEHISQLTWSPMWVWFIGIAWYASEGLVAYIIWHFFKVTRADIPGNKVVLTKVESIPEVANSEVANTTSEVPEAIIKNTTDTSNE